MCRVSAAARGAFARSGTTGRRPSTGMSSRPTPTASGSVRRHRCGRRRRPAAQSPRPPTRSRWCACVVFVLCLVVCCAVVVPWVVVPLLCLCCAARWASCSVFVAVATFRWHVASCAMGVPAPLKGTPYHLSLQAQKHKCRSHWSCSGQIVPTSAPTAKCANNTTCAHKLECEMGIGRTLVHLFTGQDGGRWHLDGSRLRCQHRH